VEPEIEALRRRVKVLAAGLGVDECFDMPAEVRQLAAEGRTVRAVRALRGATPGLGLVAAKRTVDALG
jgi:ribosomal protein L7/L12